MTSRLGNELIKELIEFVYRGSIEKMIASYENSLLHAIKKGDKRQEKLFDKDLADIYDYQEKMKGVK